MNQAQYVLRCSDTTVSSYGDRMRTLLLMVGLFFGGPVWSSPIDSDTFDPLLDQGGTGNSQSRYETPKTKGSGFTVSGHGGLYAGAVNSYLTETVSTLEPGAHPSVGFGLGLRLDSPIELGVNVDLGFGRTFEPETGENISAIDLLIEPRLLIHWYESWPAGLYAGVSGLAILFDLDGEGVSQAGVGPSILLGALRRAGPHSLFFIEAGASYFYNSLAYQVVTAPAARPDGSVEERMTREEGAWFTIFRVLFGYRLTAF